MKNLKIFLFLFLLLFGISGCSNIQPEENKENESSISEQNLPSDSVSIADQYRDIYEEAVNENTLGSLTVVKNIISRLGEQGYAAIDTENQNQINMVHPEFVEQFCKKVMDQQEGKVTFFSVMENGGFIRFDLDTSDGNVNVTRSVLSWKDNKPLVTYENSYKASGFKYTKNGYLFFDEYFPPGYDGAPGYTAIRVKPLNEECREMNEKYIRPIGYGANNMFLLDWKEDDFGSLDFYDLFAILYSNIYGIATPYETSVGGEVYLVPKEEFEKVLKSYFKVDNNTLREKTKYSKQDESYEYRTRGFYDCSSSPNIPFPEVISYEENADGTIKLTVNVVWPEKHLERAFCHEVVIRPFADGEFQYVSNHILPSDDNVEPSWYTEKFSDEELEEMNITVE